VVDSVRVFLGGENVPDGVSVSGVMESDPVSVFEAVRDIDRVKLAE
jgi:hypothetical protein